MNPPKVTDEDYINFIINFIIATPPDVTAAEAERVQPASKDAPAHDAFTRRFERLEPDAAMLWLEAQPQIDLTSGIPVLDDSTLEQPYAPFNALVYRHWSGKQKAVVSGINLITLLWTDEVRGVPADYRIFNKERDGKTKNDHFAEMLLEAFARGCNPKLVRFDSWYSSIENLKLSRSFRLAFSNSLESEPADQSQERKTASRRRSGADRRRRHNPLAQAIRANQSMRAFLPQTARRNTGRRISMR